MLLTMKGISKAFFGVKALQGVSFDLKEGEVHALVGENGAGKSTLMKILAGVHMPDEGEIRLRGEPVVFSSPISSQKHGIAIIHQELNLIPHMSVAENMFLGREPRKSGLFADFRGMVERASKLLEPFGIDIDPTEPVYRLSIGKQQIVEIAKALSTKADILIMDEPTAVLEEREAQQLFRTIRRLKEQGVGIVYISHRLQELGSICDRLTVLRDGKYVTTRNMADCNEREIANLMVGRELQDMFPVRRESFGEELLRVEGLTRRPYFEDVSFSVRKGEIVGFAGLIGAGRSELARTLFGDWVPESGNIYWNGEPVRIRNPVEAVKRGIGFATEDRKQTGLFLEMSVPGNITVANPSKISRWHWINRRMEERIVREKVAELNIKAKQLQRPVKNLSGGNQQKVVIAKWLVSDTELFIMDEPTRGIDIGAKSEIYNLIAQFASEGKAVIVISSELPELLGLCNRIFVMHQGRLKGELDYREASEQNIMEMATGL